VQTISHLLEQIWSALSIGDHTVQVGGRHPNFTGLTLIEQAFMMERPEAS
jgi:hypothetical protein